MNIIKHPLNLKSSKTIVNVILFLSLFIILAWTFTFRFLSNNIKQIWLDETLIIYTANHDITTKAFWETIKDQVGAMPWPFVEYWIYFQGLKLLPINHLMQHLELYLRFPLPIYMLIATTSIFLISRRLSNSNFYAWMITVLLIIINHLSEHLSTELRMHTSGFMHASLSWLFLTLLITHKKNPSSQHPYFFLAWVLSACISCLSHIFSTYSILLQIFIFILTDHQFIANLSTPKLKPITKVTGLSIVFLTFAFAVSYFRFIVIQPYQRRPNDFIFSELTSKIINALSHQIFLPHVFLWLIIFLIAGFWALHLTTSINNKIKLLFIFLLGLSQLGLFFILSFQYYKFGWGPDPWMSRYVMAGLIPFIFFISYFLQFTNISKIELPLTFIIIPIITFYFFSNAEVNGVSQFKNLLEQKKSNRLILLKDAVIKYNAVGKVNYVLGLRPKKTKTFDHADYYGDNLCHAWQIYTNGPFSLSDLDTEGEFGGRKGLPCQLRNLLPEATQTARSFAADFCLQDKASLRIVKP